MELVAVNKFERERRTTTVILLVTLLILSVNYYVTYGLNRLYSPLIFNFIKLSVYVPFGYVLSSCNRQSFLSVAILSVLVFFTEHVLLRVFHFALVQRLYVLENALSTLLFSFALFVPVIVFLAYIGSVAKRKIARNDK